MRRMPALPCPRRSVPAALAHAAVVVAVCGLACGLPSRAALAQAPAQQQSPAEMLPAVRGTLVWKAQRVHRWQEGEITRLLLEGDVRATLGEQQLAANRAVVWVRRLGTSADGLSIDEVFVCLGDVGTGLEASGSMGIDAGFLPVRGIIAHRAPEPGGTVTADLLTQQAPRVRDEALREFVDRAERARAGEAPTKLNQAPFTFAPAQDAQGPTPDASAPAPTIQRWRAPAPQATGGAAQLPPRAGTGATPPRQAQPTPPPTSAGPTPAPSPAPPRTTTAQPAPAPPTASPPTAPPPTAPPPTAAASTAPAATATSSPAPSSPAPTSTAPAPSTPPPSAPAPSAQAPASTVDAASPNRAAPPAPARGMLTIAPGDVTLMPSPQDAGESVVLVRNGLTVFWRDAQSGRVLTARAQRGVLFLAGRPDALATQIDASSLRGAYFEGDVALDDGQLTVRAPAVFYDFAGQRAMMLDAVLSTFDASRGIPLVLRAREVRQLGEDRYSARGATLSNSAFASPELALGARELTLTRESAPPPQGEGAGTSVPSVSPRGNRVEARGITLRSSDVPLFWWPAYSGDPAEPLIRDVRFENRTGSGAAAKVRWNLLNLLDVGPVDGLTADLRTEYYLERGVALGTNPSWQTLRHTGTAFAYFLPSDSGTDVTPSGAEIERDGDFRGVLTAYDRFRVNDRWTIVGELATLSDETFLDAFFPTEAQTRRELTTRLRGERTENNTQLTVEAKANLQDFLANQWLLQSQGYSVTKEPEIAYIRQADDLLARTHPGLLSYWSEYRFTRSRIQFDEVVARNRGLNTNDLSRRALGIDADRTLREAAEARGLNDDPVTRLDTRHELTLDLDDGPLRATPFAVVRGTLYDSPFEGFSSRPGGNDQLRLWSALGVRVGTSAQRVIDTVDSRLLDIHRLRHIVEPSATFWVAGTNVEAQNLPTFDREVDNPADGAAMRLGLDQTVQTMRGTPGKYASVDLLRVRTDVVFSSSDTTDSTPIGRFFDARPEYSALGDYATLEAAYRLTDALSLTGSTIYDLDRRQQDMTTAGVLVDHWPGFSTTIDYRFIDPQQSQSLGIFGSYRLTDKYSMVLSPTYSISDNEFQSAYVGVTRRFSAFSVEVVINYNNTTGETGFGFSIQPYGAKGASGVENLATRSTSSRGDGGL